MKWKVALVVLIALAVGLGVALVQERKKAADQKQRDEAAINQKSKELLDTKGQLESQKKVNESLEDDLKTRNERIGVLTNDLDRTRGQLAEAVAMAEQQAKQITGLRTDLKNQSDAAAKAARDAQAEMARRDARISELENNRDDLTQKIGQLSGNVQNLEKSIAETQRKLSASEGDREFLIKELKRLQTEKAELERQINDLAFLREQVKQLKEEMSIARRLDWIRRGLYGMEQKKGGQLLIERTPPAPKPAPAPSLDVELNKQGGVKVNPPATNAPPAPQPK